ncbi:MAG: hypothetical protein CM15mV25_0440 [uncultured marine virus]|nr:MAG: hypothetical protein CM15mV25_0440 [uncultured marine virus]
MKQIKIAEHGIDDLAYTLQEITMERIKEHVYP